MEQQTIEDIYDDCSWNPYSCGSEYFDNIYNSNQNQAIKHQTSQKELEIRTLTQTQPAAPSLESKFKSAVKTY